MQKFIVTILFILVGFGVKAQVKLLTLNELEQRVANGKDTTYVVNFWATWCGPCVEELPYFERLNQENLKKPLKIILMSLDFKSKLKTDVIPFVAKHKIKSEVYVVNEPDQQKFIDRVDKSWSGALPATLIWNNDKKVRSFYEQVFTYEQLNQTISKAVKP